MPSNKDDVFNTNMEELKAKLKLSTRENILDFKDIKYIPIDYESIMELLINRLKVRLPNRWSDFLESNFGMEILEAVAYEASMLAFLMNRYVNEMYLPTAKTIEGVNNLIKLVGYKPRGPIPSKTKIKFYIETPHNSVIRIPSYTSIGNGFYTTKECRIEPGNLETVTYATAGQLVIDKFLTTGILKDKYQLKEKPVSYVEAIFVNKELFTERDFIDSLKDKKVFTVEYTSDFKGIISFGDGNYGENPKEGLNMIVYYNVNTGENTNAKAFSITTINETIKDVNGKPVDVKCINEVGASGGKNAESPEQIKRNAPAFFRTQYRAVLLQDYKDIINALGYDKVTVIDNSIDKNIGIFGVKIAALNSSGEILTEMEKEEIYNEISKRKIIATQFDIVKPSIIPINLKINIGINASYIPDIVIAQVNKILTEYLDIKNRDFGDIISAMDIYTLVNSIDGVIYADNLKIEENKNIFTIDTTYPIKSDNSLNYDIKIQDTGKFITNNSYISIIDNNSEVVNLGKVEKIDGHTYTLNRPIRNTIEKKSLIYPFMTLKYDATAESKEIYIDWQGPIGEVSNAIICFLDDPQKTEYTVMFRAFAGKNRTGEKLRLTNQLGKNFPAGSLIYIKKKNPYPIVNDTHLINSDFINFKTLPKFTPGAVLIPRKTATYNIETRILVRSSETYDNLPSDIIISDIRRVYTNPVTPFKKDIQYKVNNNKSIVWLDKELLSVNKQYFVDIVKLTTIDDRKSNVKYYVNSIQGYTAKISPSLLIQLEDGDILDVESDSLNISELEIATVGNIDITINQKVN